MSESLEAITLHNMQAEKRRMGEEIIAICDKCEVKASFVNAAFAVAFLRKHIHCVFNGSRVMPEDFPYPNRQKHYPFVTKL